MKGRNGQRKVGKEVQKGGKGEKERRKEGDYKYIN